MDEAARIRREAVNEQCKYLQRDAGQITARLKSMVGTCNQMLDAWRVNLQQMAQAPVDTSVGQAMLSKNMKNGIMQIGKARVPAEESEIRALEDRYRQIGSLPGAVAGDTLAGAFVDAADGGSEATIGGLESSSALLARTKAAAEAKSVQDDASQLLESNLLQARRALDEATEGFAVFRNLIESVKACDDQPPPIASGDEEQDGSSAEGADTDGSTRGLDDKPAGAAQESGASASGYEPVEDGAQPVGGAPTGTAALASQAGASTLATSASTRIAAAMAAKSSAAGAAADRLAAARAKVQAAHQRSAERRAARAEARAKKAEAKSGGRMPSVSAPRSALPAGARGQVLLPRPGTGEAAGSSRSAPLASGPVSAGAARAPATEQADMDVVRAVESAGALGAYGVIDDSLSRQTDSTKLRAGVAGAAAGGGGGRAGVEGSSTMSARAGYEPLLDAPGAAEEPAGIVAADGTAIGYEEFVDDQDPRGMLRRAPTAGSMMSAGDPEATPGAVPIAAGYGAIDETGGGADAGRPVQLRIGGYEPIEQLGKEATDAVKLASGYGAIDEVEDGLPDADQGVIESGGEATRAAGASALPSQESDPEHTTDVPDDSAASGAAGGSSRTVGASTAREGFNDKWQRITDRKSSTPAEELQKAVDMHKLAMVFTDRARFLAELIAAERTMYEDQRSIRALDVGGVAGGDKHLVGSVFIKYAVDTDGMYGGDGPAQKSAAHELKGLRAIRTAVERSKGLVPGTPEWEHPDCVGRRTGERNLAKRLHVPLFALVDFAGHRMVATALLPVGKKTLVYGSADAGRTVHDDNPVAGDAMQQAGSLLGLKPHVVGRGSGPLGAKEMAVCCDIEVHDGKDGRLYVLDTARLLPPEEPHREIASVVVPSEAWRALVQLRAHRKQRLVNSAQYLIDSIETAEEDDDFGLGDDAGVEENIPTVQAYQMTGRWAGVTLLRQAKGGKPNHRLTDILASQPGWHSVARRLTANGAMNPDDLFATAGAKVGMWPAAGMVTGNAVLVGQDEKARHLVRLLREEALRVWTRPISSDAFTGFGAHGHKIHNAEARGISQALIEDRIPVFADELATHRKDVTNGRQLVDLMHAAGLNARWLALVYVAVCVDVKMLRKSTSSSSGSSKFVRNMLLTEMIARSIKLIIRDVMREALPRAKARATPVSAAGEAGGAAAGPPGIRRHISMDQQADNCQVRLKEVLCSVMNDVFGSSERALSMWTTQLKAQMMLRFGSYSLPPKWFKSGTVSRYGETIFFSTTSSHPHDDMRSRVLLPALLGSMLRATGLSLTPAVCARAIQDPGGLFSQAVPFQPENLERVSSQAKSIQTTTNVLAAVKQVTGVSNPLSSDLRHAASAVSVPMLRAVLAQSGARLNMKDEGDRVLAQIPMPFTSKSSVPLDKVGAEEGALVSLRAAGGAASGGGGAGRGELPESKAPAWEQYSQLCQDVFGASSSEAVAAGLRQSEELFREGRALAAFNTAERAAGPLLTNPSTPTESVVSVLAWMGRCKEQANLLGDALERYKHALWRLRCEFGTGTVKQTHSAKEKQMAPDPAEVPEQYRAKDFDIHGLYDEARKAKERAQAGLRPNDPDWHFAQAKLQEDFERIKEQQRQYFVAKAHTKPREHNVMAEFLAHPAQQVLIENVVRIYVKAGLVSQHRDNANMYRFALTKLPSPIDKQVIGLIFQVPHGLQRAVTPLSALDRGAFDAPSEEYKSHGSRDRRCRWQDGETRSGNNAIAFAKSKGIDSEIQPSNAPLASHMDAALRDQRRHPAFASIEAGSHDLPCQEGTVKELARRLSLVGPDRLQRMLDAPLNAWNTMNGQGRGALARVRGSSGKGSTSKMYTDSAVRAQWIFSVAPFLVPSCMVMRQPMPKEAAQQPPTLRRDASHGEDVSHVGFPMGDFEGASREVLSMSGAGRGAVPVLDPEQRVVLPRSRAGSLASPPAAGETPAAGRGAEEPIRPRATAPAAPASGAGASVAVQGGTGLMAPSAISVGRDDAESGGTPGAVPPLTQPTHGSGTIPSQQSLPSIAPPQMPSAPVVPSAGPSSGTEGESPQAASTPGVAAASSTTQSAAMVGHLSRTQAIYTARPGIPTSAAPPSFGSIPQTAAQRAAAARTAATKARLAETEARRAAAAAKQPSFRCDSFAKSDHDGVVRYHVTWSVGPLQKPGNAVCSPAGDVWIRFSRLRALMEQARSNLDPSVGKMLPMLPEGGIFQLFRSDDADTMKHRCSVFHRFGVQLAEYARRDVRCLPALQALLLGVQSGHMQ